MRAAKRWTSLFRAGLAAAPLLVTTVSQAGIAPAYTLTNLTFSYAGYALSDAIDMNNAGDVISRGYRLTDGAQSFFLSRNGQTVNLGNSWSPTAIGDSGVIVGNRVVDENGSLRQEAVKWANGNLTILDGGPGADSYAVDVNASGATLAWRVTIGQGFTSTLIVTDSGTTNLPGNWSNRFIGWAISESGKVAGQMLNESGSWSSAAVWDGAEYQYFSVPAFASTNSYLSTINSHGQVAGGAYSVSPPDPVIAGPVFAGRGYPGATGPAYVSLPSVNGFENAPSSISDKGLITIPLLCQGCLFSIDGTSYLGAPQLQPGNWGYNSVGSFFRVNNAGQILGGSGGCRDADCNDFLGVYVLTPAIPEPSASLLFMLGVGGLGLWRSRRIN